MKIKVYSGLSLSEYEVREIIPKAFFSSPVARGDLLLDIARGFHVIAIIDGVFMQQAAVSPTDIRDAMRCGLKVYGSSSMGALRAAELEAYGMIGYGRVFDEVKKIDYFKDDHLGQTFFQHSLVSSLPFIDFSIGLNELVEKCKIGKREAKELRKAYEQMHFTERNIASLKSRLKAGKDPGGRLLRAALVIEKSAVSIKKRDGIGLLKRIASDLDHLGQVNARLGGI